MKWTRENKLLILEKTLQILIKSTDYKDCICIIIGNVIQEHFKDINHRFNVIEVQEAFDLRRFMPINTNRYINWWSYDEEGRVKRIRVVGSLINELNNEKETTEKGK